MGDPLSALGAVAGAVQLADAACKLSSKLFRLFSEIKDAPREIKQLRDTLHGLGSATRTVHQFLVEHGSSFAAIKEYEVLPKVVRNLSEINSKLKTLHVLTSGLSGRSNSKPKLTPRLIWVYHKRSIISIMSCLEHDKSSLTLTMQALDLRINLKSRTDMHVIQTAVLQSSSALHSSLYDQQRLSQTILADCQQARAEILDLKTHLEIQTLNGEQTRTSLQQHLLSTTDTVMMKQSTTLEAIGDLSDRHQALVSDIQQLGDLTEQHKYLENQIMSLDNQINEFKALNATKLDVTLTSFEELKTGQNRILEQGHEISDTIGHLLQEMQRINLPGTRDKSMMEFSDAISKAVEAKLHKALLPAVALCFESLNLRDSEKSPQLQETSISSGVDRDDGGTRSILPASNTVDEDRSTYTPRVAELNAFSLLELNPPDSLKRRVCFDYSASTFIVVKKTYLNFNWRIGQLGIIIKALKQVRSTTEGRTDLQIIIHFRSPVISRGFSFMFRTGSNGAGYFQLCPSIATYRLLDIAGLDSLGFFDNVLEADMQWFIKRLMRRGIVSPLDRSKCGFTLLHFLAFWGQYESCKLLIDLGADPRAETCNGWTPLHGLFYSSFQIIASAPTNAKRWILDGLVKTCSLLETWNGDSSEIFVIEDDLLGQFLCNPIRFQDEKATFESWRTWGKFLDQRSIDLDYVDEKGMTPLMRNIVVSDSSDDSYPENISMLLSCGANPASRDLRGRQALHYALNVEHLQDCKNKIERYIQNESGGDRITNPRWHERVVQIIVYLIKGGADIYAFDNKGWTPANVAQEHDTLYQFHKALEICGIPLDVYRDEHNRRVKIFKANKNRLYQAERTAIDKEMLELPSHEGLVERRKWKYGGEI